jgi:hypothetical protein
MNRGHLRRRVLVDWPLQGSLIAHVLAYGGLVMLAIVGGLFAPLLWDLASGTPQAFAEQSIVMVYLHERFWLPAALCAVILALCALRLSHRIAGPLVRYKRNLRLVADGRLPSPLRTRDGDYLKEEVACLNAAVAGVAARVDAIRRAHRSLQATLAALPAGAAADAERLDALARAERELARAIGAFRDHETGDERAALEQPAAAVALAGGDSSP